MLYNDASLTTYTTLSKKKAEVAEIARNKEERILKDLTSEETNMPY